MANPQPTDAHLRIAHSIEEQLMVSDFTEQQRRILDLILRLSWGCGKKYAIIPKQSDFEVVKVSENKIKAHLDWLVQSKVIYREGPVYCFNKNFERWQVSRSLMYNNQKMSELLRINLTKNELDEKGNLLDEKGSLENRNFDEELDLKSSEKLTISQFASSLLVKKPTSELASPKENVNKYKENVPPTPLDENTPNESLTGSPPVTKPSGETVSKTLPVPRERLSLPDDVSTVQDVLARIKAKALANGKIKPQTEWRTGNNLPITRQTSKEPP